MSIPRIFISYSHKDEVWKDRLLTHLRVLERRGMVDLWDTSRIQAGANWVADITKAISEANIALLLISPDFLASDFIVQRELPILLEHYQKRGLTVLSILIQQCFWASIPALAQIQFLNDPENPLAALSPPMAEQAFASIGQKIVDLVEAIYQREENEKLADKQAQRKNARPAAQQSASGKAKPLLFISHSNIDGDFAELLQLRLERAGYRAWVDVDRLIPGVDWRIEIDKAIKDSLAVIAVMSPEARESEYVTYEWAFAWGCGKNLIPIMLRQTTMHPRLATLQFLDFSNRRARPWERLLEAINSTKNGKARKK
jgi:TIR domain